MENVFRGIFGVTNAVLSHPRYKRGREYGLFSVIRVTNADENMVAIGTNAESA